MLHLLLWDVTETQDEYSNYLLVLSPIGSALGACIGLYLALHSGEYLFIAAISSFFSTLILVAILNTQASHNYSQGNKGQHQGVVSEDHPPLIPSIRLIINTFEFKRVFKVSIICLLEFN